MKNPPIESMESIKLIVITTIMFVSDKPKEYGTIEERKLSKCKIISNIYISAITAHFYSGVSGKERSHGWDREQG